MIEIWSPKHNAVTYFILFCFVLKLKYKSNVQADHERDKVFENL